MAAAAGELRQIEFKRQFGEVKQQQQQEVFIQHQHYQQDKSLQDLRAFALEYVKQIVARANELSQKQQQLQQEGRKQTSQLNCQISLADFAEVARRINGQFPRLQEHLSQPEVGPVRGGNLKTVQKSAKAQLSQPRQICELPETSASIGRETLLRRIEDEEGEEEHFKRFAAGPSAANSGQSGAGGDHQSSSQRRKLYQRLNWHLLVSCFANCLPQNLVERTAAAAGVASGERVPGSGSGGTSV